MRTALITGVLLGTLGWLPGHATAAGPPARIAFNSANRIFTINADGSDRRQLTGLPGSAKAKDSSPTWSPDGSAIAFMHSFHRAHRPRKSQIYAIAPDGSAARALTAPKRAITVNVQWSPDGQWLAFDRFVQKGNKLLSSIVLARSDGAAQRTLVKKRSHGFPTYVWDPTWSPDGTELAFTRTSFNKRYQLESSVRAISSGGNGQRLLAPKASDAAWAPDGSRIAFVSDRDENGEDCGSDECFYNGEIYVMRADGANQTRLTRNEGNDFGPDWSADGQRIAFSSDRNFPAGGSPELYSMEPDGSCLTWLTNGYPESAQPDWEPDRAAGTDPGGCGATPRPPLVEVDASRALMEKHFQSYWLGKDYRKMLLTHASAGRHGVFLDYGDCGSYDPPECGEPFELAESWICDGLVAEQLAETARYANFMTRRGALVTTYDFVADFDAYTGASQVTFVFYANEDENPQPRLELVDALQPIQGQPIDALPVPAFPHRLLRQADRATSLFDRLGNVKAVARKLGTSKGHVRELLALALHLNDFGPVDGVGCPRHRGGAGGTIGVPGTPKPGGSLKRVPGAPGPAS